jgi:hypothetical protein
MNGLSNHRLRGNDGQVSGLTEWQTFINEFQNAPREANLKKAMKPINGQTQNQCS